MKLGKEELASIKLQAKNEIKAEMTEKVVGDLKYLYEKLESARNVVRNIKRDIEDYEMTLEE